MAKGEIARKTIYNTTVLGQLGNAMDSGVVPVVLRKFMVEGMSGPIDAYMAMLRSTALSLKGKGTGPMTDNDFDNLLSTAGSVSANPEARGIIQQALSDNARIALKISDISSRAISGDLDRLEATRQINALMQASPLTDKMKTRLGAISAASVGGNSGGQEKTIKQINAELANLRSQRNKLTK